MSEWGVTGTVYLQQITAQSPLFGLKPQPERHLGSSRTTTSSYSPLPHWVLSTCATVYIAARQEACGQPRLAKLTGLQSGQSRYRGSISGKGKQFYCFPNRSDRIWGRPTFLFLQGTGGFPQRVKRLWHDHSPPYSVNVQKWWMFLHSSHTPSWHRGN